MHLFALDPGWSDFYSVGGFLVGVVGFGITIWQLRKTKHAAEAAAEAARATMAESKEAYERFVGAFASRLFSELLDAVNGADWKMANVRSNDLAELLGTLPATGIASLDDATRVAGASLRDFAQTFAKYQSDKKTAISAKLLKDRWKPLLQLLHRRLDRLRAPFRENNDGQIGPFDPAGEVPGDRPKPPGEDEVRSGELDQRRVNEPDP